MDWHYASGILAPAGPGGEGYTVTLGRESGVAIQGVSLGVGIRMTLNDWGSCAFTVRDRLRLPSEDSVSGIMPILIPVQVDGGSTVVALRDLHR